MTDAAPTADRTRNNRLIPLLMALLFFGPLALAIVMYYVGGDQWRPSGSVAHGILLSQPRTLPTGTMILPDGATADFGGKWSLLYVGRGDCDDACKEALYRTRQVRRALGKEASRVQRIFISTSGAPNAGFVAADHPGLLVLPDGLAARDAVLATLGEFAEGDVFIADPLGNVVLRFPPGTAMKDMHQDLALLLKASQIG
ncbi:MAG: SCO family protein [Chromatiales bacterium]|nr:SCO family protein [Chromatiales bacterium]